MIPKLSVSKVFIKFSVSRPKPVQLKVVNQL